MQLQGGQLEDGIENGEPLDSRHRLISDWFGISNQSKHDLSFSLIGNYIGGTAAADRPDIEGGGPQFRVAGQTERTKAGQGVQKLVDGRIAQLGVGRMRGPTLSLQVHAEHALAGSDDFALRGLAVDQEARRRLGRGEVGGERTGAVALFAADEQQAEIGIARGQQFSGGEHLGRDDALGVTRAATVDELVVFATREKRRHGIEVSTEHDPRVAAMSDDVEAPKGGLGIRNRLQLNLEAAEFPQASGHEAGSFALAAGGRINIHEGAQKIEESAFGILMHMARITNGCFAGPVGRLEYILSEPDESSAPPRQAAVVCHPHPLFGGTMHTKIVFQTAKVMLSLGLPVLRFNYRGVGKSQGSYDHGQGELADLGAAMTYLRERFPLPLVLGGFSFGATMVAKTLASAPPRRDVRAAVLLGLPTDARDRDEIPTEWAWQGPKLLISGAADQFASVASLERYFAALAPPKQRAWIAGGDHFMSGQADEFREALRAGLDAILS